MTFEEWWEIPESVGDCFEDVAKAAWDAATEEVKKDHFKIGEEVERKDPACNGGGEIEGGWEKSKIVACSASGCSLCGGRVRRIPAWEPKDGEVVFAKNRDGSASVAKCTGATSSFIVIKLQNGATGGWVRGNLKPFDPDKIGKPWDEV